MRCHLWIVVALCACGKSSSSNDDGTAGATTPEGAVRGFVEGIIARDADRARRFLPDDAACEGAPAEHRTPCLENGRAMRAQVDGMLDEFPAGAKITAIERSPDAPPAPELGAWTLKFDGGHDPEELMTVKIGNRYYAAFAMRRPDRP